MHSLDDCLRASASHHRQLCPRQVLGVRMGLLAGRLLGLDLPRRDRQLLVILEVDGCTVDGVVAATGCSPGHRTLRIEDYGKVAGTFVDAHTGQAVRLVPHPQARAHAASLSSRASTRWQAQLIGYQRIRDEDLFLAQPVTVIASLERLLSHSGARDRCQGCGEEILNERQVDLGDSIICRACAGYAYYRVLPGESAARERFGQLDATCEVSPSDGSVGALAEEDSLALPVPAGVG